MIRQVEQIAAVFDGRCEECLFSFDAETGDYIPPTSSEGATCR